jgi:hypothetical protein
MHMKKYQARGELMPEFQCCVDRAVGGLRIRGILLATLVPCWCNDGASNLVARPIASNLNLGPPMEEGLISERHSHLPQGSLHLLAIARSILQATSLHRWK